MRVIEAFDRPVRAVTVSADGRLLAAASDGGGLAVWDWADGRLLWWVRRPSPVVQIDLGPGGSWLAACGGGVLNLFRTADGEVIRSVGRSAGGVAYAPDGRHLVASEGPAGGGGHGRLHRWTVPDLRAVTGFDNWPPFTRLVFSPDGQYLAGINPRRFELRIAVTGGLNGRGEPLPPKWNEAVQPRRHAFLSFSRDSATLVAGWDDEFSVLDTVNGNVRRRVRPDVPLRDAAFTGGRHLGTVDATGVLRLWDAEAWAVERAYDWRCGPLTCVAFTADGLAGVCGTEAGRLVLFDLDE